MVQLEAHAGDTEREMDILRQFQQTQTFHLLAMDLQGRCFGKLSDHLSDLADLILSHTVRLWLARCTQETPEHAQFAVIAYGKLGGRELGYASDLDLVFLYDADEHPDAGENYARLAQRINTMLSSYTSSGRLYEIDLRLRPNGESGLLVSSVGAFEEYQRQHAWVWEHQALTRARFCAGDAAVGATFARIRNEVLCMPRDVSSLRLEVVEMRRKMHDGHPNKSDLFDIKQDSGGMVDIEFLVQFLVLAHAAAHPELTVNRGNLALLEIAAKLNLIDHEISDKCANCTGNCDVCNTRCASTIKCRAVSNRTG